MSRDRPSSILLAEANNKCEEEVQSFIDGTIDGKTWKEMRDALKRMKIVKNNRVASHNKLIRHLEKCGAMEEVREENESFKAQLLALNEIFQNVNEMYVEMDVTDDAKSTVSSLHLTEFLEVPSHKVSNDVPCPETTVETNATPPSNSLPVQQGPSTTNHARTFIPTRNSTNFTNSSRPWASQSNPIPQSSSSCNYQAHIGGMRAQTLEFERSKLMKPVRNPFCGEVHRYATWIRQLKEKIRGLNISNYDVLNILECHTAGPALEVVHTFSAVGGSNADEAVDLVFENLERRFGNRSVLADHMKKMIEGCERVRDEDDVINLRKLSDVCLIVNTQMEDVRELSYLDTPEGQRVVLDKVCRSLREAWRVHGHQLSIQDGQHPPFNALCEFLSQKEQTLSDPAFSLDKQRSPSLNTQRNIQSVQRKRALATTTITACLYCNKENHSTDKCFKLTAKTAEEVKQFIQRKGLCYACLCPGHRANGCGNRVSCTKCRKRHPTVLHLKNERIQQVKHDESEDATRSDQSNMLSCASNKLHGVERVLVPMIHIKVKSLASGLETETLACLDTMSTETFVTDHVLRRLNVNGTRSNVQLATMTSQAADFPTKVITGLQIQGMNVSDEVFNIPTCLSTSKLPINKEDTVIEGDVESAFSSIPVVPRKDLDVGMLIGMNMYQCFKPLEVIEGKHSFATKHSIGWTVCGNSPSSRKGSPSCLFTRSDSFGKIHHYFNQGFEDNEIVDAGESKEDRVWEGKMVQGLAHSGGQFQLPLPFKEAPVPFVSNKGQAYCLLQSLKRRLLRNTALKEKYIDSMNEMVELGFAEPVDTGEETWFIPHHPVINKVGKFRIVFNCSQKYQGASLNDRLISGPNLTSSLYGVLLRFRQGAIAVTGDIEKMFYMVKVQPSHRNCLCFLWFPDGDLTAEPFTYRLAVHVFGATSSPSVANYALQKCPSVCSFPVSTKVQGCFKRNFYVDDFLFSADSITEVQEVKSEVKKVCEAGGFNLRSFNSNVEEIRDVQCKELLVKHKCLNNIDNDPKVLGMKWLVDSDQFCFVVENHNSAMTKRGVLSQIGSIFDPLGFLAPVVIVAKVIFQELCRSQSEWDQHFCTELQMKWTDWLTQLNSLMLIRVPRPMKSNLSTNLQLHSFGDASELGFGCVTYLRSVGNQVSCQLITSRSRVSPLKKISIPRLELSAAKLAVEVHSRVVKELDFETHQNYFWTDSITVLAYLRNREKRFQRFVANRVSFIQSSTEITQWKFVPGHLNPADIVSRGATPEKLVASNWFSGPSFLQNSENEWNFTPNIEVDENELEIKGNQIALMTAVEGESITDKLLHRFSSWCKLKTTIAWILRFLAFLRKRNARESTPLSLVELQAAEISVIRFIQGKFYADEILAVQRQQPVSKSSKLRKLSVFLDTDNVLRVGGRIQRGEYGRDFKHPYVLPNDHHVVKLIVREMHKTVGHMGRERICAELRERYWIVSPSKLVRQICQQCVVCRKTIGQPSNQFMSDLPLVRCQAEPPFTNTGLDCFGPFFIKERRSEIKRYGIVFSCLASRAVHLEVLHDMSTPSFLNALRRFIGRRGAVKTFISDNGTNFVGANNLLIREAKHWNQTTVDKDLHHRGIEWKFNPPYSSHFGGVWEREIRTIRNVISSIMMEQNLRLNDDSISTLFCEVEAILNGRPLTCVSSDHNDLEPLSPNHLLQLKGKPNLPPGLFSEKDRYSVNRWRQVQYLADLFWRRWRKEYLQQHQRTKWTGKEAIWNKGDIVVIVDAQEPRNHWKLGRVIEPLKSSDGRTRIVQLKTKSGVITRPICKLVKVVNVVNMEE